MTTIAMLLKVDGERVADSLEEARDRLAAANGEAVLDFSSVRRLDPRSLKAMEQLHGLADKKGIKIGLCSVKVEIYKVLKLAKLAPRFFFRT